VLSDQEVHALLNSFRKLEHSPKRDYAMVRCLSDLGLRASEVAQLRLKVDLRSLQAVALPWPGRPL
jgi:integrase/recombinase XerD